MALEDLFNSGKKYVRNAAYGIAVLALAAGLGLGGCKSESLQEKHQKIFEQMTGYLEQGDLEGALNCCFDPGKWDSYRESLAGVDLYGEAQKLKNQPLLEESVGNRLAEYNVVIDGEEEAIQFFNLDGEWKIENFSRF